MSRNGQWLVCGPICKDLRKKWFECANLKTLKVHEELSVSFVFCEKVLSHRCLCLTLTRKLQAYDQIRRRPGEIIGDHIVREQRAFHEMTEALRRVRNSRNEKSGVRRHDHRATSGEPPLSALRLNTRWSKDEDTFIEAPWRQEQTGQTFFKLEIGRYRLLQNARLSQEERQMVWAGTRNDTEYTTIVTQLRGARDDQDLRERDRGGKSFERAARFILQKPTLNGMLNKLRTASRVMHLSWR